MINDALDTVYTPHEQPEFSFEPLPENDYSFVVKTIEAWKESIKTIKVIQRDSKGNAIKDESGKNVTVLSENHKFYNAKVILEVIEDDKYAGRLVYTNITTHPNMPWSVPAFLHATGQQELKASMIQATCVGSKMNGKVAIEDYTVEVRDEETGDKNPVTKQKNVVSVMKAYKNLGRSNTTYQFSPTLDIDADDLPF